MDIQQCKNMQTDILGLLKRIEAHCQSDFSPLAHELAQAAIELGCKVKTYITTQDPVLYPAVDNGQFVAHIAHRYRHEMTQISTEFLRFVERWHQAAEIAQAPQQFYNDAKPIFEALKYRIHRESTELYPKIEQLMAAPQ